MLRVMVEHLPPNSAMHRRNPRFQGWTVGDHMTADLWDALNALVMLTSGQYEQEITLPPRRPRPGDEVRIAAQQVEEARAAKAAQGWLAGIESATGARR